MRTLTVKVSDELHRHLRKYALQYNMRMQDVVREAIEHETHYGTHVMVIKTFPRQKQTPQLDLEEILAH